ncbi:PQQ-binding-like beta-propeller repeat protein [Neorhodopirellula pilleata]|uniref:Outer membrane biogenesis protein BamB n=1 Tax=Neorhodopirellula pilleata TaxID=2714738 RepID=A0A5C5ZXW6_9BACT|nr:PQQ-binding-like beta-propeller repeat protein [Neorhodopirellula pilleata]TWT91848.1 outer membrane biogenesis protein BamB [Neorhodopirellula pilleata]
MSRLTTKMMLLPICLIVVLCVASPVICRGEDWPQWRGDNRDAQIDDPLIAKKLSDGQLPLRWKVPVGPGYSGPTVANGRVYLTDRQGEERDVVERVLCFDAETGKTLWTHEDSVEYSIGYSASGPRAAVTIHGDKAIAVGGTGRLSCLQTETGKMIWSRDLESDYQIRMPIWGITAAPLVHDGMVIQVVAGTGDACLVAFDLETGQERWRAIDEKAGYSAPIIVQQGQQDVLVCWTGESVTGLNPSNGETYWSQPMKPINMPIGVPTPVVQNNKLLVSSFYDGSMLIALNQDRPAASQLWWRRGADEKNTDSLHSMISNPLIKGEFIYGVDSYGQFRCLDLMTGDRVWEDLSVVPEARWATVHMIQNGNDEIMLNERGELLMTTLSPQGIEIRSRSKLLEPTLQQLRRRDGVVWAHPAIADGVIYARNDRELVSASLR